nr:hypothetical protein [Tanacetum cinerariifolium]
STFPLVPDCHVICYLNILLVYGEAEGTNVKRNMKLTRRKKLLLIGKLK